MGAAAIVPGLSYTYLLHICDVRFIGFTGLIGSIDSIPET